MEALACTIRNQVAIQGITIDLVEKKISLSADDTLFVIKAQQMSFDLLMEVLDGFTSISNLKINRTKSQIVQLGKDKLESYRFEDAEDFQWVGEDTFKYVGIPLHNNKAGVEESFYLAVIEKLKQVLRTRDTFNIDLLSRITFLKSRAASILVYYFTLLPPTPTKTTKMIQNLLNNYMWGGMCTLYASRSDIPIL